MISPAIGYLADHRLYNQAVWMVNDGVYQDGCLIFEYPSGKYRAFFMAFQSQSFDTDDKTGHANQVGDAAPGKPAKTKDKRKKPRKKKHG